MKKIISSLLLVVTTCILTSMSCHKHDHSTGETLHDLYNIYKNGEISECSYNGMRVYCAGLNAYDAGSAVYDDHGNQIAVCNYAWGTPDPICSQLQNCEVVYRVTNHISGLPPVNKYGLE